MRESVENRTDSRGDIAMKKQIKKNPNWRREELILALDLYFKNTPSGLDDTNPDVIKLSEILNNLGLHDNTHKNESFRSPNSVSLKLQNFRSLDPQSMGRGMPHASKLDRIIWDEFSNTQRLLKERANTIKTHIPKGKNKT